MRNFKSILVGLVAVCAFVACTVGEESPNGGVTYVDSDGDGITDGVDTDGDGDSDRSFGGGPTCSTCVPGGVPVCTYPLVDLDNDGIPDGLDIDCDGDIDYPFDIGGGGGGGNGSYNQCNVTIQDGNTKQQVTCNNGSCECRLNDQLVQTCVATQATCSFPGNCCGFQ
jgi:hypothetical protein